MKRATSGDSAAAPEQAYLSRPPNLATIFEKISLRASGTDSDSPKVSFSPVLLR